MHWFLRWGVKPRLPNKLSKTGGSTREREREHNSTGYRSSGESSRGSVLEVGVGIRDAAVDVGGSTPHALACGAVLPGPGANSDAPSTAHYCRGSLLQITYL